LIKSNCPACGAGVQFSSSVSLTAVCAHCRTLVIRKDLDIATLGKVAQLQEDGSPLRMGVVGQYRGAAFAVVGRIQMKYDGGYWSEWHITLSDGRSGWLGESMGQYMISFESDLDEPAPALAALEPGSTVQINGKELTVKNIDRASYFSAEGELPDEVPFGKETTLVDLAGEGGKFATLDFSESPPTLYEGEYATLDSLRPMGMKPLEGWPR
jgi:hypothetical protein